MPINFGGNRMGTFMHEGQRVAQCMYGGDVIFQSAPAPSFTGVLDNDPNVIAAWAMRVLRSAMVGQPLFRLYGTTSTLESDFWIAAPDATGWGTHVNGSGQTIAQWMTANSDSAAQFTKRYDQLGDSDKDMVQATTGTMPIYTASAINSRPAPNYVSAAGRFMQTAGNITLTLGNKVHVSAVYSPQSRSANQYVFSHVTSGTAANGFGLAMSLETGDVFRTKVYVSPNPQVGTVDESVAPHVLENAYDGSALKGFIDNIERVSVSQSNDITSGHPMTLGRLTGIGAYADGYLGEVILRSAPDDRATLVADQAAAWGITL